MLILVALFLLLGDELLGEQLNGRRKIQFSILSNLSFSLPGLTEPTDRKHSCTQLACVSERASDSRVF